MVNGVPKFQLRTRAYIDICQAVCVSCNGLSCAKGKNTRLYGSRIHTVRSRCILLHTTGREHLFLHACSVLRHQHSQCMRRWCEHSAARNGLRVNPKRRVTGYAGLFDNFRPRDESYIPKPLQGGPNSPRHKKNAINLH